MSITTIKRFFIISKYVQKYFNVAVVGGGPVGLATALMLADKGNQVSLFEKRSWPIDKACGQGLMPSGLCILESLDIKFHDGVDCQPFYGVSYIDQELCARGQLDGRAIGVERSILSQKLFDKVCSYENIKIYSQAKIIDVKNNSNNVGLKVIHKNEAIHDYNFDYLFACDGLFSTVSELLNNSVQRRDQLRMGARTHYYIAPWSDHVEVYWSNGAEAYVTPVSDEKVEVAFLWYKDETKVDKSNLKESLLSLFPQLEEKLTGHQSLSDFRAYGPFDRESKKMKLGHTYFIGDAYSFLDGITGEGMSLGLRCAYQITKNFHEWKMIDTIKVKTHYLKYKLFVRLALSLSQHRLLRKIVFKLLQKNFSFILKINDTKCTKDKDTKQDKTRGASLNKAS